MAMSYESVLAQLADVTYGDAISHYANMKQRFYHDFESAIKPELEGQGAALIDQFVDSIPSYTRGAWPQANEFINNLADAIVAKLDTGADNFPTVQSELDKKYHDLSAKARKELTDYINLKLDLNEIVTELLKSMGLAGEGAHTTGDIIAWAYGYARTLMFKRFQDPTNTKGYNNPAILAGYFEEALFNNAAQKLTKNIEGHTRTINTGSVKGAAGVDTAIDQFFDFLSDMEDAEGTFEASMDLNNATLKSGYGAQVKLWKVPWEVLEKNRRASYHIGNRAGLLEDFNSLDAGYDKMRGWIQGIHFLEGRVREALGDNVFYITNTVLTWTCDLISNFRQMNYFLAFHYEKVGKPGKGVGWEQIDMSKAD